MYNRCDGGILYSQAHTHAHIHTLLACVCCVVTSIVLQRVSENLPKAYSTHASWLDCIQGSNSMPSSPTHMQKTCSSTVGQVFLNDLLMYSHEGMFLHCCALTYLAMLTMGNKRCQSYIIYWVSKGQLSPVVAHHGVCLLMHNLCCAIKQNQAHYHSYNSPNESMFRMPLIFGFHTVKGRNNLDLLIKHVEI
jgi:hypothetical protein